MADEEMLLLSGSTEKQLNKGRRRKIRPSEWTDNKNKALRNAGKPFRNRKGTFVPGKCASEKTKIKFNVDISDKRGTRHNRPRAVSFDVKELVRDHISSMPAKESQYSRSTSSKLYLSSERCVERMYGLFKASHSNIKCSRSLYRDIFRSEFKLRFGPPRSDSYSYFNELCIHLVAAETEDEQKRINISQPLNSKFLVSGHKSGISTCYMDKEDFTDLSAIEGMFKKQPDLKITSFHWIQFSSEEPNTVRTRVSRNNLQPWHSYVIRPLPRGRKYLCPLPTVLPQLYEEAIAIKKAKNKGLARHVQINVKMRHAFKSRIAQGIMRLKRGEYGAEPKCNDPAGKRTRFAWVGDEQSDHHTTTAPIRRSNYQHKPGAVLHYRAGGTGDSRENPPTNDTVRHESHLRKTGDPAGD
ncbi:hypothetical protein PR048_014848 [Dryococelus australis]|uniref:Uncharacterized protein n=1 Tax=Dryococelus australis TaxID=614101 RepID=A0ABQ9HFG6_9NEOP|nr:hypothetical protein PR048_014848 [Dryococelus australis]